MVSSFRKLTDSGQKTEQIRSLFEVLLNHSMILG